MKYNRDHKKVIIEYLKNNGKANLAELKKLNNQHQPILYNIRRLLKEGIIRPYIKINPDTVKSIGIMDNEIFFAIVNQYQYPQEIIKLIDEMCGDNIDIASQALEEFIKLYQEKYPFLMGRDIEKGIKNISYAELSDQCKEQKTKSARKLAYLLMSGILPNLKEKVAISLSTGKQLLISLDPNDPNFGTNRM